MAVCFKSLATYSVTSSYERWQKATSLFLYPSSPNNAGAVVSAPALFELPAIGVAVIVELA